MNNNKLCDPSGLNGTKENQFHGALKLDENEKTFPPTEPCICLKLVKS